MLCPLVITVRQITQPRHVIVAAAGERQGTVLIWVCGGGWAVVVCVSVLCVVFPMKLTLGIPIPPPPFRVGYLPPLPGFGVWVVVGFGDLVIWRRAGGLF